MDDHDAPLNAGAPHDKRVIEDVGAPEAHLNHALNVQGELPVGSDARSALPTTGTTDI